MEKQIDNGGPAFPFVEPPTAGYSIAKGMTLRDYFAACMLKSGHTFGPRRSMSPEEVAEQAYQLADAMLKARKQ